MSNQKNKSLTSSLIDLGAAHPELQKNLRPILDTVTANSFGQSGGRPPAEYRQHTDVMKQGLQRIGLWNAVDWEFSSNSTNYDTSVGWAYMNEFPNGDFGEISINYMLGDQDYDARIKNWDTNDVWSKDYQKDLGSLLRELKRGFDHYAA